MPTTPEPLFERERELEALAELVAAFPNAPSRIALIEAPAGIGKTALVRHAEAAAQAQGLRVLSARGSELERDYPFALVAQLFAPVLAGADDAERAKLLGGAASLAEAVLEGTSRQRAAPEPDGASPAVARDTADRPASADPGYAALHGLYWLLSNLVDTEPALLSIDDLHWADAASLRFLSFLEARLEGMPVLVVCARRPREPGIEAELLDRIGAGRLTVRVGPRPLTLAGSRLLLARSFDAPPEDAFAVACHDACAGNPFYLELLASELRGSGIEPTAANAARVESLAPATIARTVLLRLGRLEPAATELAKAVAVLGDEARLEIAAELAGLSLEEARDAADDLAAVSVLRRSERLSFVHPIVRATIRDELAPHERSGWHRRAAELLRAAGAAPELVAGQLLRSTARGDADAVEQLRAAASHVVGRGAPEAAIAYLSRALSEPPPERLRSEVLTELGLAEAQAAEPVAAEHLLAARDAALDPIRRGEIALELGRVLMLGGALSEGIEALEVAAAETREARPELSARLALETRGVRRVIPGEVRAEELAEIEAMVPPESPVQAWVTWSRAMEAALAGEPSGGLAEAALADSGPLLKAGPAGHAFVTLVNTLTFSDRFEAARRQIDATLAAARREGSVAGFATMSGCRAALNRRTGRLVDAEADARAALDAAEAGGMQILEPMWLAELAETAVERGEAAEAERELERRGLGGEIASPVLGWMFLLCARGRVRATVHDPERGLADLEACGRRLDALRVANPAMIPWRSHAASTLAVLGERPRARALAEEEVELARRGGVPTALARSLRVRGLVEGGEDGLALLREALSALAGRPLSLERAHVLVELGAALRRAGHRADAREPLGEGHELAERFEARPLAERARVELEAAGARPRRLLRQGLDALTASERRVAEMAADGLSNAEIAQALFVTLRTVETHLTSAYSKLEIRGRRDLRRTLGGFVG